jgi:hypothetical protein
MLLSKLQDVLGETTAANSVVELIGLTEESALLCVPRRRMTSKPSA